MTPQTLRTVRTAALVAIIVGFASATFSVRTAIPAARTSALVADAVGVAFGVTALRRLVRPTGRSAKATLVLAMLAALAFAVTTVLAVDALCLHGDRTPDGGCLRE